MLLLTALLLLRVSRALPSPWWPWSWETLSVHAFPGASPRFMNAAELNATARFTFANVWGLNGTCVNASSTFPAHCGNSHCDCAATASAPEQQHFLPVMETSLQAQAAALKAAKAPVAMPVFGYLNSAVMQQWSAGQNEINTNGTFAAWRMNLTEVGVVDCFKNDCDYQGMEYRVLDFRIPDARAWWVTNVLGALIDAPGIDGTFLDESNNFVTNLCPKWGCTPAEQAAVTAGQLALVDDALAYAASIDKFIMVSLTCTFQQIPDYCSAAHASMLKHGSGIRFYEFFGAEHLEYLIYEAQTLGLPVVAHAGARTMNPDWVELAIFLVGAGPYSYFSFSSGWDFDSFAWEAEYDTPLGAPLTPATAVNTTSVVPPWAPLVGTNIIYSLPPAPGKSNAAVTFLGNVTSAEDCAALVDTAAFAGWAWVSAADGLWSLGCYGRVDDGKGGFGAQCFPEVQAPPCSVALEAAVTSAVRFALAFNTTTWSREFEFLSVTYDPANQSATITQRAR
jgi:hypothetical protein